MKKKRSVTNIGEGEQKERKNTTQVQRLFWLRPFHASTDFISQSLSLKPNAGHLCFSFPWVPTTSYAMHYKTSQGDKIIYSILCFILFTNGTFRVAHVIITHVLFFKVKQWLSYTDLIRGKLMFFVFFYINA